MPYIYQTHFTQSPGPLPPVSITKVFPIRGARFPSKQTMTVLACHIIQSFREELTQFQSPQGHADLAKSDRTPHTHCARDISLYQALNKELGFEIFDEGQERLKGKAIHQSPVLVNHRPTGIFQN